MMKLNFAVHSSELENLNFKTYLDLESKAFGAITIESFDPLKIMKDCIMLEQDDQSCTKNLKILCKYDTEEDHINDRVKYVSADENIVAQILNKDGV